MPTPLSASLPCSQSLLRAWLPDASPTAIVLAYASQLPPTWLLGLSSALHGVPLIVVGFGHEYGGDNQQKAFATMHAASVLQHVWPRLVRLQADEPMVDVSGAEAEAEAMAMTDEADASVVQRGYDSLRVLCNRPERCIAVCAHGGLFHKLLNDHPLVNADEATRRRFGNAELGACTMRWAEGEGEPKIQLSATSLSGDVPAEDALA